MTVDLRKIPTEGVERNDFLLFSESQSRFVVTVHPDHKDDFEKTLSGQAYAQVGTVREGDRFELIGLKGETIVQARIQSLKEAWQRPLSPNDFTL